MARQGPVREHGSAVLPGVLALLILIALVVGALNVVLDEYAKGALRSAVDEGAQAGATSGSATLCAQTARQARRGLLPGPYASRTVITCRVAGAFMQASATAHLPSLLPMVPAVTVHLIGLSAMEGEGS
jgi:hypothetical protein